MKIVFALALLAVAVQAAVISTKPSRKIADVDFLKKQKKILKLYISAEFYNVYQSEYENFDFDNKEYYTSPEIADNFAKTYKRGMLEKNGVFTMYCHKTRHHTFKLFDLLYFAKDFETFFKVASWARHHVHQMQFMYAFTAAVYHRADTQGIIVPPFYELFPHYFVPSYVMHKAYRAQMLGKKDKFIYYNSTSWEKTSHSNMFGGFVAQGGDFTTDVEGRISYFREDVGLNYFYTNFYMQFAPWLNETKHHIHFNRRGEIFYYVHQQLFARYNLERITNGLPPVEVFKLYHPIHTGYDAKMTDEFGRPFVARPDNVIPDDHDSYGTYALETFESRILDSVHLGAFEYKGKEVEFTEEDGIDHLGEIVYGSKGRKIGNYYGHYFFRGLETLDSVVRASNDREFTSSVLGHIMTSLRDPVYYQFLHRMMMMFQSYKNTLHPYSYDQMYFPDVKVEQFEVGKLVTYFDRFDFEITNGLPLKSEQLQEHRYTAKQFRLNHKPFTYSFTVNSGYTGDAMVRVFLGPKNDADLREITLDQARHAFVQIDKFPVKLTPGSHKFERNSREFYGVVDDHESYRSLYERVAKAIDTKEPFYYHEYAKCGYPHRLILPRGWQSGYDFQFYIIVTPYEHHESESEYHSPCSHDKFYDGHAFGFPFDRKIYEHLPEVDNAHFYDVKIYHREEVELNRN